MTAFLLEPGAARRIDDIYDYTRSKWGPEQAERYINELFDCFDAIAGRRVHWRAIPEELGVEGWFHRHRSHQIYWKQGADRQVRIFAVLHVRMDLHRQLQRANNDPA